MKPARRLYLLACLGLLCCRDQPGTRGDTSAGGSSSGPDDDGASVSAAAASSISAGSDDASADSTTGPDDCVAGQEGCACLADECTGTLHCIEQECVAGPELQVPEDRNVLAGLRVPLRAQIVADAFTWLQVGGPTVEILQADSPEPLIDIPAEIAPGEVISIELAAVRNTVIATAIVSLTIVAPTPESLVPDATSDQLATTEGIDMAGNNLWVVSTEGFVSRIDPEGVFQSRFDVPGTPVGALIGRVMDQEVLVLANRGLSAVQTMNLENGELNTLTDAVTGGGTLGPVNMVLPRDDGYVFFTNRDGGQVFVYEPYTPSTQLFIEGLGSNPNSIAFGLEPNILYVGTWGQIHRVPIIPNIDADGVTAGEPSVYLDFGPTTDLSHEVDGLVFDEGGNLWVGSPNNGTLFVAPYVADGATAVRWSLAPEGSDVDRFVNLRFGRDGFDRMSVYYTNLDRGTVGRMYVGVEGD